jgi:acetylornithine deacetylase/succinyl-diaminopimelate desuccinylase-like protein
LKAAFASMLVAATRWSQTSKCGRVQLILVADEEAGSALGAELIARGRHAGADAIVVAEPAGMSRSWEALYLVARGMTAFELAIHATQGHSGLSEHLGTSATVAAAHLVTALAGFEPSYPTSGIAMRPTVNAAVQISGGVFYGVHPGLARVANEVRLVPGMDRDTFEAELRQLLDAHVPEGVRYDLNFADGALGWVDAAGIAADHPLVGCAQRAALEVLGSELPLAAYPGGTDACFFATEARIPSIAAFGPGLLSVAHGANEYVPIRDIGTARAMYEFMMHEFAACDPRCESESDSAP